MYTLHCTTFITIYHHYVPHPIQYTTQYNLQDTQMNKRVYIIGMQASKFGVLVNKEGVKEVKLHNKYEVAKDHAFYEVMEYVVQMANEKDRYIAKQFPAQLRISYFSSLQFVLGKCKMQEQICTICMEQFQIKNLEEELAQTAQHEILTLGCSHKYHRGCLLALLSGKTWLKCPVCGTIYGVMLGDQPQGTIIITTKNNQRCEGYDVGTIIVQYQFKGGVKDGKEYPGTNRTGYLPDTPEGREVRDLLKEAFNRRLTFTIGRSVTTGLDNQIVWNGIHHKTSFNGGPANFGYPDPTYLKRVKEELAVKGVVPK